MYRGMHCISIHALATFFFNVQLFVQEVSGMKQLNVSLIKAQIANLNIIFFFNPARFGNIFQTASMKMRRSVEAEVKTSRLPLPVFACTCSKKEFRFNFVHLPSPTWAKRYSSLQAGGGAGPPPRAPPLGASMSFKLCWVTNVLVICLKAAHSSPSRVCICLSAFVCCVSILSFRLVGCGRMSPTPHPTPPPCGKTLPTLTAPKWSYL